MTSDSISLRTICQKNGLAITDIQLEKLVRYAELLREWNQKINLVSRKDEENIWTNHLLLSVALLFKVEFIAGSRVLDLGTGGGLPGIPLSILRPDMRFVLLDSIQKKITAVSDMIRRLELPNAAAVCSRAEAIHSSPGYVRSFDAVIARAVSGLDNVVSWANPFLKPVKSPVAPLTLASGRIRLIHSAVIAMKGGETQAEVEKTARLFPRARIQSMQLVFDGGEVLANSGKQIIIVENL